MNEVKLTTSEKTELLIKIMAGLGISISDLSEQFKADPEPEHLVCEKCFFISPNDSNYCCNCGTKFEPEKPIIKESGETFVARVNGKDYFCTRPNQNGSPAPFVFNVDGTVSNSHHWQLINSDLKITDEIAKLRPIIIDGNGNIHKMYGVDPDVGILTPDGYCAISCHRLATTEDLS